MIPEIAQKALHVYYGYDDFRPAQKPVVKHLLEGKDCLAIMPTGAGKSICFQIPAVVRKGITLVFTPLISLMKDQVDGLQMQQVPATYINSTLERDEVNKRMYLASQNRVKLLYLAPEKLESESFRNFLRRLPIAQVIIDEAHCVSQWGHDFRKSYGNIAPFIESLPRKPIIGAFTATATREVEDDILKLLGLSHGNAKVFKLGFDRPNLHFSVVHAKQRIQYVLEYVRARKGKSGVIYCSTRKAVEEVYEELVRAGFAAGFYHGGLSDDIRKREQERYANDEIEIMVATNAFGMGIDKSNVRYVLHYQMPRNMEGYYQEAGRAGRDGAPAECCLLFNHQDVKIHQYLIDQSIPEAERRRLELERLQSMVDYCYTPKCLRNYILSYFGETTAVKPCRNCGSCEQTQQIVDLTQEAKAIFKAIAVTEERFGAGMIADIVTGNLTERISKMQLQRHPVFGSLQDMTVPEVKQFIKMLSATGYLEVTTGKYPLLILRAGAQHVMAGYGKVEQPKIPVVEGKRKSTYQRAQKQRVNTNSDSLFEYLRQFRKSVAEQERVRPYLVLTDTVLIDMAARAPHSLEELQQIKGIGKYKLEKYGKIFLDAIVQYEKKYK